jgi:Spy/CpxP family protein refolding chaperone
MQRARTWIWFLLIPALLGVGIFGLARANASGPFCRGFRGHHAAPASAQEVQEHLDDKLDYLFDEIDATPAQRKQISAQAQKLAPEIFALMNEGRELRGQLKAALLADKLDQAHIDELRGKLDLLTDRVFDTGLDGLVGVSQVLTPAQRKQVADKLARFHH